ncbi:DNA-directed RNA polymerase subunit P [archaeon]|nr:MAG: DNA-directed RNA polymerase subunit P [archaeon]
MYRCISCKKQVEDISDKIRCPYCGARVFLKSRAEVATRVRAR